MVGNLMANSFIKNIFRVKRPIGSRGLTSLKTETATGYSFPSGHTQMSTTFWTGIATRFNKKSIYTISVVMAILVGISRMYLGVHWPTDVLFGWILGLVFTVALGIVFDYVDKNKKYWLLFILPVILIIVDLVSKNYRSLSMIAVFLGFAIGYTVEDKYVKFDTYLVSQEKRSIKNIYSKNKYGKKNNRVLLSIGRLAIGITAVLIVYLGVDYAVGQIGYLLCSGSSKVNSNIIGMAGGFIKYLSVVFFATAGAPAIFKLARLD
jgi:hypothetical protein